MSEQKVVNMNLLKAAKIATLIMLLLILGQSMTGVGAQTTGLDLSSSHVHAARLGLVLGILTAVAIVMSGTDDSKLKAFGFESATFWVVMYGLGEMSVRMDGRLSMLHAPIGLLMFARMMMMAKAFPSDDSAEAKAEE